MQQVTSCPDADVLSRFLLGRIAGPEAVGLEQHLSSCGDCAGTLQNLKGDDTLLSALRSPATGDDPADQPVLHDLIVRMKALQAAAADATASVSPAGATFLPDSPPVDFLAPPEAPDEVGRLGPYRVLKVLGLGGMGVVFRAHDPQLDRHVALKVLLPAVAARPSARRRFLREAKLAASIEHDHIVPIYQVGEDRDIPYLAMQLLQGQTLEARLRREGKLPPSEVLRIGRETAEGLAAAHEHGLIHRDIKPANLWLEGARGRVKVLDFGLARGDSEEAGLTEAGTVLGTPAYMAPEQAAGKAVDARCDLFSLGCVLYQMGTGTSPFQRDSVHGMLYTVINEQPAAPASVNPALPAGLSELIVALLEKNPARRPQSARAVVEQLAALERRLHDDSTVELARRPMPAAPVPPRRRSRIPLAAAALLGLLGIAAWFWGPAVFRFTTNKGELVVEVDDKDVEVTVKQGGAVVVDRKKSRSFVLTAKGGEIEFYDPVTEARLLTKEFTLERGGKTVVRAREELAAARKPGEKEPDRPGPQAERLADKEKPFVLLRKGGDQCEEFNTLAGVVQSLDDGDKIEVYGNGPFRVEPIVLRKKALNLRAAPGYRPQLVFVAPEQAAAIMVEDAPLFVEGCDIRSSQLNSALFGGGGAPWEFRNCRLMGGHRTDFGGYRGPKLRLVDCLISIPRAFAGAPFSIAVRKKIKEPTVLEMANCIVWSDGFYWQSANAVEEGGEFLLDLDGNTMLLSAPVFAARGNLTSSVTATGNLFQAFGMVADVPSWKKDGRWQGKDNLYVGPGALQQQVAKDKDEWEQGLAAWMKNPGVEERGAREAEWVYFPWDEVRRQDHDPAAAAAALQSIVREARRPHETVLGQLGPDWSLVGSGDAYVRALAAAGKPVAKDDLRPAPLPGGPVVLWQEDKVVRGYPDLVQAETAAVSGDTIEIRSDGPLAGPRFSGKGKRVLTIRAAPGYQPVIKGSFDFATPDLALVLEGLHFSEEGIATPQDPSNATCAIRRLANCSFGSRGVWYRHGGRGARTGIADMRFPTTDGKPAEIVNCFIPGYVRPVLAPGDKLQVRNSVIGTFLVSLGLPGEGVSQLELERSVLWNPCGLVPGIAVQRIKDAKTDGKLALSARGCLFEPGAVFIIAAEGTEVSGWTGSRNLYRIGHRPWITGPGTDVGPLGLDEWRRRWKSDVDSVEAEPVDYQPQQWRLQPGSPGSKQGPDGKDIGADVDRIGKK